MWRALKGKQTGTMHLASQLQGFSGNAHCKTLLEMGLVSVSRHPISSGNLTKWINTPPPHPENLWTLKDFDLTLHVRGMLLNSLPKNWHDTFRCFQKSWQTLSDATTNIAKHPWTLQGLHTTPWLKFSSTQMHQDWLEFTTISNIFVDHDPLPIWSRLVWRLTDRNPSVTRFFANETCCNCFRYVKFAHTFCTQYLTQSPKITPDTTDSTDLRPLAHKFVLNAINLLHSHIFWSNLNVFCWFCMKFCRKSN